MARTDLALLALVLTVVIHPADAADQALSGKKLLVKNPPAGTTSNKIVHLAKDPALTIGTAGGAGDPQCSGTGGGGGSVRLLASGGAGDVTIALPCAGWSTNAANSLYRYTDPTGATCKIVLVKAGVLAKAVCKGSQVGIDLNSTMAPVAVVTTLNSERYCTSFDGTVVKDGSNDVTFLARDAAAPGACPATPTTTSSTITTSTSSTTSSTVVCTDLLVNGSFEQTSVPGDWTYASTNFGTPLCTVGQCGTGGGTGPRTGLVWVWLGGTTDAQEIASASQLVTIPAGSATLTFWMEIPSCDTFTSDTFAVRVDGVGVYTANSGDPSCGVVGYVQRNIDLSAYADGGPHTIEFRGVTDSFITPTNFFVDDVTLNSCP